MKTKKIDQNTALPVMHFVLKLDELQKFKDREGGNVILTLYQNRFKLQIQGSYFQGPLSEPRPIFKFYVYTILTCVSQPV